MKLWKTACIVIISILLYLFIGIVSKNYLIQNVCVSDSDNNSCRFDVTVSSFLFWPIFIPYHLLDDLVKPWFQKDGDENYEEDPLLSGWGRRVGKK